MCKEYETKQTPSVLLLTTCTSPLTITRIVNTHFGRWSRLVDAYSTHRWHANLKWLLCDVCYKSCSNIRCVKSALVFSSSVVLSFSFLTAVAIRFGNWLQLPCDSGFGTEICVEIRRSRACQEQIQHGISIRSWTCRHSEVCCQCCLPRRYIPCMYLLSCVNCMDENANFVHRAHDQ